MKILEPLLILNVKNIKRSNLKISLNNLNFRVQGRTQRRGKGGSCPSQENRIFFSNIVFEFAELFLVAILDNNFEKSFEANASMSFLVKIMIFCNFGCLWTRSSTTEDRLSGLA